MQFIGVFFNFTIVNIKKDTVIKMIFINEILYCINTVLVLYVYSHEKICVFMEGEILLRNKKFKYVHHM